jgi:hypothetical protein
MNRTRPLKPDAATACWYSGKILVNYKQACGRFGPAHHTAFIGPFHRMPVKELLQNWR